MNGINQRTAGSAAKLQTPLGVQALTLLVLVLVWELIGRTGVLLPDLFPSITEILQSLWIDVTTPIMLPHLKASLYEVGGAIAIASLFGIPLGILWGSKRSWLEIVEPLILYAAVVPKIVIFPVFILFLGIDVQSKLAIGAIAAFFPVSLLTIAGMREVKKCGDGADGELGVDVDPQKQNEHRKDHDLWHHRGVENQRLDDFQPAALAAPEYS